MNELNLAIEALRKIRSSCGYDCARIAQDALAQIVGRPCTCHPDDNPPRPCPRKYAYSECAKVKPAVLHNLDIENFKRALGCSHMNERQEMIYTRTCAYLDTLKLPESLA